jgi:cytochrome P450
MEAFSRSKIESWLPAIERDALRICRPLRAEGTLDVVHDFAEPWSAAVAGIVTGQSFAEARNWARAVFTAAAEPFDAALQSEGNLATEKLAEIFPCELAPLYVQAFVALSESLPAFIGNACYALLQHRQWGESLDSVEELLRYAGPSKAQLRRAQERVEIGGATVERHDRVILMLASANRDCAVFAAPHELDFTRCPNSHVAFGAGAHSCLGGALVKMASFCALRVLFETFPVMTLESATLRRAFALRAIKSLRASTSTTLHPAQR